MSLPKPVDSRSTVLVIARTLDNEPKRAPFRYYNLKLQGSDREIRVRAQQGLLIVRDLPSGDYVINRVESVHMSDNRTRQKRANIRFSLTGGEITLLPYAFDVEIREENRKSKYYQYWKFRRMEPVELEEVRLQVDGLKNRELWR